MIDNREVFFAFLREPLKPEYLGSSPPYKGADRMSEDAL